MSDINDFPLLRGIIGAVLLSLFVSFFEIRIVNKLKNYFSASVILLIGLLYNGIVFFLLLIFFAYTTLLFKMNVPFDQLFDIDVFAMLSENLHTMFFYFFIFLTVRFLSKQLRIRTLHGFTRKYYFGKAGEPVRDYKIFMFMDLVSSTSYAEKLGFMKYSKFISEIYNELDEYVLATKGNIYQYVGDEVVVVWSMEDGLQNSNCVRFYLDFNHRMNEMSDYFEKTYGIIPQFKAAFHCGEIAVAEIGGVLRKDIAFHGDTINTTARICSQCRRLNEQVLLSGDLIEQLNNSNSLLDYTSVGSYQLRGKNYETELFKISLSNKSANN